MILLSKSEIQTLISIDDGAVSAIRDAYVAVTDGRGNVPPVGHLDLPRNNGECHIKYGYISGDPVFVVKIAVGFYDNPSIGLPSSNGVMVAASATTGQIVAVLSDEGWLTDLRTGIGGAVATFALCRSDSRRFGIVGTGTQSRFQARALAALAGKPIHFAVWGRSEVKANELANELQQDGLQVEVATDLADLCRDSDVIVTTTPSTTPLIKAEWITKGTHITAMGADTPGKQELDENIVVSADVRVSDISRQCLERGEFAVAFNKGLITENDCVELGQILSGKAKGRTSNDDITIADLTGIATQDIAITRTVLERVPGLGLAGSGS
ncbi:ornithine cyclodeaminase family protein [Brucella pituitosa]|uniref:ornithine cyclodeaminase family protein n=1 Tax=Brucella pituitosa TaxID=571256 RepID=UPI000C28036D|nr:ornithine cyclodeaminase [Brucella pituitosa]PJO48133.1 ornithine cyclodeaminase [Brucella pituitosa]